MPIPTSRPSFSALLPFALAATLTGVLRAQCTYSWPAAAFGTGANDAITALASLANGDLVAGGRFSSVDGVAVARIARWNGSTWSALGSGMSADVYALLPLPSGELAAAGAFVTAGGVTTNCVARWNGTAWSGFGNGIDALAPFGSNVQAMALLSNGDLVVAGSFNSASGTPAANIARWNGTAWSALGAGTDGPVRGLAVAQNGDLYATGTFTLAGGLAASSIARWNGSMWSALGTGLGIFGGSAVAVQSNGDVIVGGTFVTAGGLPANRIARWNGTAWSAFTSGTDNTVHEIVQSNNGDIVLGGEFTNAAGAASNRLARVVSSCAPVATSLGTGCSGSGGQNSLTVQNWPLVGSTFRATSTGMPAIGIVLAITGFTSTALPIAALLPQGLPGCTLYANLDLLDALLPTAGSAASAIALGINPALIGATLFHQHVPLELDLSGNITAISSTNALQLTVGTF